MKKVKLGFCLVIVLICTCFTACTDINSNTLRVGTALSFPPYEYTDTKGNVVGIDIDIMQEIANRMGKELVVETMEFDDLFVSLQYGKIDVIAAGLTVTDERKKTMDFTESYASGEQKILVSTSENINTVEELQNSKVLVGIEKGTTGADLANSMFTMQQIREYDDATKMMDALHSGIVGAVVVDKGPAEIYAEQHNDILLLDSNYDYEEYALAMAKGSNYTEQITTILHEMIEDGTVKNIINNYN